MTTLELPRLSTSLTSQKVKRAFDLILALILLAVVSPLIAFLAAMILLESPGPALYRGWRIGVGGRPFRMLKLRSMVDGAEGGLESYLDQHLDQRAGWEQYQKLPDDPRLTVVGRFLRRWSLDELPQLWNVVRGEMSLVGPRPILPSQRELYGAHLNRYAQVRPGITGLWQVSGRNRTSFAERAGFDDQYVRNWSFGLDLRILLRTVVAMLRGEGVY